MKIEDAKQLLQAIRIGTQNEIADHQIAILEKMNALEEIYAKPDYEISIVKILEKFGPSSLAFIQQVLSDSQLLGKARKALAERGRIQETPDGARKMLSLVEQPVAA
jgi:hypothetical protein